MTWVEGLLLLGTAGVVIGLIRRRTRAGRAILWLPVAIVAGLPATYGREVLSDLL